MKNILAATLATLFAFETVAQDLDTKKIKPKGFGKKTAVTQEFKDGHHIIRFMSAKNDKFAKLTFKDNGNLIAEKNEIISADYWAASGHVKTGDLVTTHISTGQGTEQASKHKVHYDSGVASDKESITCTEALNQIKGLVFLKP